MNNIVEMILLESKITDKKERSVSSYSSGVHTPGFRNSSTNRYVSEFAKELSTKLCSSFNLPESSVHTDIVGLAVAFVYANICDELYELHVVLSDHSDMKGTKWDNDYNILIRKRGTRANISSFDRLKAIEYGIINQMINKGHKNCFYYFNQKEAEDHIEKIRRTKYRRNINV